MHNALFSRHGLPHTYHRYETTNITELTAIIRSPHFGGASVTIPLKLDVVPLLDEIDSAAHAIGAVNTIVTRPKSSAAKPILVGHNTDWQGMVHAIRTVGAVSCSNCYARPGMVVGGGGTARAAIYALRSMSFRPIYLVGRNMAKLIDLASHFDESYDVRPISAKTESHDLKIAKRPVVVIGTIPGDARIESDMFELLSRVFQADDSGTTGGSSVGARILLDMAYEPATTGLKLLASKHGWTRVSGLEALIRQGICQFHLWTGILPSYSFCRAIISGSTLQSHGNVSCDTSGDGETCIV